MSDFKHIFTRRKQVKPEFKPLPDTLPEPIKIPLQAASRGNYRDTLDALMKVDGYEQMLIDELKKASKLPPIIMTESNAPASTWANAASTWSHPASPFLPRLFWELQSPDFSRGEVTSMVYYPVRLTERRLRYYAKLIFPDIHLKQTKFIHVPYRPGELRGHEIYRVPGDVPFTTRAHENTIATWRDIRVNFRSWYYGGRRGILNILMDYKDSDDICFIGVPDNKPPVRLYPTGDPFLPVKSGERRSLSM